MKLSELKALDEMIKNTGAATAAAMLAQNDSISAAAMLAQNDSIGAAAMHAQNDSIGAAAMHAQNDSIGAAAMLAQNDSIGAAAMHAQNDSIGAAARIAQEALLNPAARYGLGDSTTATARVAQEALLNPAARYGLEDSTTATALETIKSRRPMLWEMAPVRHKNLPVPIMPKVQTQAPPSNDLQEQHLEQLSGINANTSAILSKAESSEKKMTAHNDKMWANLKAVLAVTIIGVVITAFSFFLGVWSVSG